MTKPPAFKRGQQFVARQLAVAGGFIVDEECLHERDNARPSECVP